MWHLAAADLRGQSLAKTFHAPTLTAAEVRFSIVDEYILLRLDTAYDQTWWRLSRENFIGLSEYLNDEARRMKEQ